MNSPKGGLVAGELTPRGAKVEFGAPPANRRAERARGRLPVLIGHDPVGKVRTRVLLFLPSSKRQTGYYQACSNQRDAMEGAALGTVSASIVVIRHRQNCPLWVCT